jgi:PAS domain S-box-containing protein
VNPKHKLPPDQDRGQQSPPDPTPVIGTTDQRLVIDRIGTNAERILGYPPAQLVGQSVLTVADAHSAPVMLGIFLEAIRTQADVSTSVAVRSKDGHTLRCELVVFPLVPSPASAFALLPGGDTALSPAAALRDRQHEPQGVEGVTHSSTATPRQFSVSSPAGLPGAAALTTRELEVVVRLVSGDRVLAIAERMFISRSTVRNHLLSVFRKLRVHSQQELVDLFRITVGADASLTSRPVSAEFDAP